MYLAGVPFQTLRNRLAFWFRPWRPLRADQPDDFKVYFDGRALEYQDHLGKLELSLDWAPGTCGVFSHWGTPTLELDGGAKRAALGARYDIAVQRAKEFLEWGGFQVEIFDPLSHHRKAAPLREEWRFEGATLLEKA